MVQASNLERQLRKGDLDRAEAYWGTSDRHSGLDGGPPKEQVLSPGAYKRHLIWGVGDLCRCDYTGLLGWVLNAGTVSS